MKKELHWLSVFDYANKEKHPIYVSQKLCEEKHVEISLIREEGRRHCVPIKDFTTFIYDHSLHHEKKKFLSLLFISFQCRRKCHTNDCFQINGK